MGYFYGILGFTPSPEKIPWCVTYAVWDIAADEIVSLIYCGKVFRVEQS